MAERFPGIGPEDEDESGVPKADKVRPVSKTRRSERPNGKRVGGSKPPSKFPAKPASRFPASLKTPLLPPSPETLARSKRNDLRTAEKAPFAIIGQMRNDTAYRANVTMEEEHRDLGPVDIPTAIWPLVMMLQTQMEDRVDFYTMVRQGREKMGDRAFSTYILDMLHARPSLTIPALREHGATGWQMVEGSEMISSSLQSPPKFRLVKSKGRQKIHMEVELLYIFRGLFA